LAWNASTAEAGIRTSFRHLVAVLDTHSQMAWFCSRFDRLGAAAREGGLDGVVDPYV